MKKIETRLARIEDMLNKKTGPVHTYKLIFFGVSELMPKEQWSCGNVTFMPVLYEDVRTTECCGRG